MTYHNWIKCLTGLAITSALVACGGKSNSTDPGPGANTPSTPASTISELERTGAIPKLDRSDSLAGPDANNDGVRDDIEAYIKQAFQDTQQRAAAMQSAKALQSAVVVDVADPEATKAVSRNISRSTHCLYSRFHDGKGDMSPSAIGAKMEAMTANTKKRMKAYLAYNRARDGTSSSLPKGDTCE